MSREGRAWYARAAGEIAAQNPPCIKGRVTIEVILAAPTKRSYDPDNKIKVLFDSLVKAGVIEDDSNRIIKYYGVDSDGEGFRGARLIIRKVRNEEHDTTSSPPATKGRGDTSDSLEGDEAH